ncbi:pentatricopeptide repeat-containing protein At2g02750 [Phragmites australis]|uniref:pentatricopeptide repeat-containing protein At2g02750 n=1 Tax=Phragmites australis TaxID=29695 RepID=UPI002D773E87|nr:pentatricopeptide repeat-containing protein At2g02750 [Phragmites australis]XP_062218561.1 pentatricopeptide repeat-containing protein At2g02750 [Phragmites australis]XP_062218562.1 pentatricopeptide repeat-containing protein At2g02750 [Phragmites australis]XP_062218563.1 pentatricopeptide repeat-containing protein At2g02750 [Phragmites australis]
MAGNLSGAAATPWKRLRKLVSDGRYSEALLSYSRGHASGLRPGAFTFPCLLKSCAELKATPAALQLHAQLAKSGLSSCPYAATALTSTYARLGRLRDARRVFDEMPERTVPCFNALVAGLAQRGEAGEARRVFRLLLREEGLLLSSVTVASVLPACAGVEQGEQLHGLVVKTGDCLDRYVATALITMYLDCGGVSSARRVLEFMVDKGVESYNAMASGLLRNGEHSMALGTIKEMVFEFSEEPNETTLLVILSACSSMSVLLHGKEAHCYVLKRGMDCNIKIGTALVDMYSKCGSLECAYLVFSVMKVRNLVSWNTMISSFLIHEKLADALGLFEQLRLKGFDPDSITCGLMINGLAHHGRFADVFSFFCKMRLEGVSCASLETMTSLLNACSAMSDIQSGKVIYCHVIRTMQDFEDDVFQTTVIDMFMSCGCDLYAGRVFDKIKRTLTDPVVWNAMISGYGKCGKNDLALQTFNEMLEQQVQPNSATFLCALSACSHAGLVQKAMHMYQMMEIMYKINPTVEHLSVMVDLFCRAGKIYEAYDLLLKHPNAPASMWYSFLGACRNCCNVHLGEIAATKLYDLDPTSITPWVILSNIYAAQDRWSEVERLRELMLDKSLSKVSAYSELV